MKRVGHAVRVGVMLVGAAWACAGYAPVFRLEDQHGVPFCMAPPLDRPLVLLLADREGRAYAEQWTAPLYDRYGPEVDLRGVADLSALPKPFRNMVRRIIRARAAYSLLLDWNGEVVRAYAAEAGPLHVVIVTKEGVIARRVNGRPNEARISEVYRVLDALLESAVRRPPAVE